MGEIDLSARNHHLLTVQKCSISQEGDKEEEPPFPPSCVRFGQPGSAFGPERLVLHYSWGYL